MWAYTVRRTLLIVPLIWAVVTLVFIVLHLVPGNPAAVLLGPFYTQARARIMLDQWGLNRPLWYQYVSYLRNVATGNFGVSYLSGQPASEQIWQLFPFSFFLGVFSIVLSILIGIPTGIVAAMKHGTWVDQVVLVISMALVSAPSFFLGLMLLFVFSAQLGWLPSIGDGSFAQPLSLFSHTLLPAIALSASLMAYIARMTRSSLLAALKEDYSRTARAKGVTRAATVLHHALKNATIPVLSIVGVGAGQVIGGAAIIETVFARPGLGQLLVNSVTGRDYVQVQALVIVLAAIFVIVNLIVDLMYAALDPRIQYR